MEFVNDPVKSKRIFILMLVLTIVFFLGAGALGYLYYHQRQLYKTLAQEKENLENQLSSATSSSTDLTNQLKDQLKTCQTAKTKLDAEKKTLADANKTYVSQNTTATAYANFLKYRGEIIDLHDGLQNISQAEYDRGYALAQATGNSQFTSTVNWAWNQTDISQAKRLARVIVEAANGVINNSK